MLTILLYVSLFSGGILIIMLLLSLVGGLDFDLEADLDAGGLGLVKGFLMFVSTGSFVVRSVLLADKNPLLAFGVGAVVGLVCTLILSMIFKWILSKQENTNWNMIDSLYSTGTVYLTLSDSKEGIVTINVKGVNRELKAFALNKEEIPTGSKVIVEKIDGDRVLVSTITT